MTRLAGNILIVAAAGAVMASDTGRERICVLGVNLHHDLGALGAALHVRTAERQLEILREMGCNALRTAHNPPAPGRLDLADRMGFLV